MRALSLAAILVLGACGSGGLRAADVVRLQVEIRPGGEGGTLLTGLVICDEERRGTGIYESPADSERACRAVRTDPDVQRLLFEEPRDDRACPEVYGGPQRAKIAGVIDGREVDVAIDRTDGCGIDSWRALEPLIGSPPDPGPQPSEPVTP